MRREETLLRLREGAKMAVERRRRQQGRLPMAIMGPTMRSVQERERMSSERRESGVRAQNLVVVVGSTSQEGTASLPSTSTTSSPFVQTTRSSSLPDLLHPPHTVVSYSPFRLAPMQAAAGIMAPISGTKKRTCYFFDSGQCSTPDSVATARLLTLLRSSTSRHWKLPYATELAHHT